MLQHDYFIITAEQESIIFKTSLTGELVIQFHQNEMIFTKNDDQFEIELDQIKSLAAGEKTGKIKFFLRLNNVNHKINLSQVQFTADTNLSFEIGENSFCFHVDKKGNLIYFINEIPSARSYYRDNSVEKVHADAEYIYLDVKLRTEFLKAENVTVTLLNPKTGEKTHVDAVFGHVTHQLNENHYDLFIKFLLKDVIRVQFNHAPLNLVFEIRYEMSETISKPIKFNYNHQADYQEEIWIEKSANEVLGIFTAIRRPQPGKFGFNTVILDRATYETYSNFEPDVKREKPIIIIGEYKEKAQDNGLHLFKHINQHYADEVDCYYVILSDSKDLANLQDYPDRILCHRSPEHVRTILEADALAFTHSNHYLFPFYSQTFRKRVKAKKFFLQHGILGAGRDMSYLYGKGALPFSTDYFIVSSQREKDLVSADFGYDENQVLLTGLARFDKLLQLDKNQKVKGYFKRKQLNILIMPTWRKGMSNRDIFLSSPFYKHWYQLLNSPVLAKLNEKYELKIQFYAHHRIQGFLDELTSDYVEILAAGVNVQQLLKESDLLITDYSSVGLDFAITKKPVIYYQFDSLTETNDDDFKTFLPGDIVASEEEVLDLIKTFIRGSKVIKQEYQARLKDDLFCFDDTSSCDRIYREIKKNFTT